MTRPDQAGLFELRLVLPGEYLVAAVDYVEDGEWNDPEYLKSLVDRVTKVRLEDRQTATVDLTLRK